MVVWHACIQYHLNSIVYHLRHCSSHTIQQLIVVCSCVYVLDVYNIIICPTEWLWWNIVWIVVCYARMYPILSPQYHILPTQLKKCRSAHNITVDCHIYLCISFWMWLDIVYALHKLFCIYAVIHFTCIFILSEKQI